jgi:hypothetical protein
LQNILHVKNYVQSTRAAGCFFFARYIVMAEGGDLPDYLLQIEQAFFPISRLFQNYSRYSINADIDEPADEVGLTA